MQAIQLTVNPNIDPIYWWLTAIALPLWIHAIYWNWRAVRSGVIEGVKLRAATATLAALYLAANCILLFTDISPAAWSDFVRPLMLLSIPIVWAAPAKFSVEMAERIRNADRRAYEKYDGEYHD